MLTPGPWLVELHPNKAPSILAQGETVAEVCTISDDGRPEMANARLIVAAHDLLAACENVLDHFEQLRIVGAEGIAEERLRLVLEGVIAKAKGGTP